VKQVLQDLRSGAVQVLDVPEPQPAPGYVLVAVEHSLISSGTERAMVSLGAKSLLGKAKARPDLVRRTLDVARNAGVGVALTKVRSRLDRYAELGYSCAGTVIDAGGDERLTPGARVACIGAGYANHAGVVSVPVNLVVPIPPEVSTADAAFAAPAAIALHALRLSGAGAGSVVAVIGLGLIGQLTGRLAVASGCLAVGTDPRPDRCTLFGRAASLDGVSELGGEASRGRGADAVLLTAATASSEPVTLATTLARDRAAIVAVGDVGLELDRRAFYEKELSLVVARYYGPGRYDRAFEERGVDLPPGHVRWTEGRNVEAVLDLLATGRLQLDGLVTHRFAVADGESAYAALRADEGVLSVLLDFPAEDGSHAAAVRPRVTPARSGALRVGVVGVGNFARGTLLPLLKSLDDVEIVSVCARSGASARSVGDRYRIAHVTTDWSELVRAEDVDAVVIATPHAEHAEMTAAALEAGKAVFVEKPLAVDYDGLERVASCRGGLLLVGHNRRFAELSRRLRQAVPPPSAVHIRVAAGPLPSGHWLEDPSHGGRVLGEISHFVDLAVFLARDLPASVDAAAVDGSVTALVRFPNGSAATIAYGVGRTAGLAKERVEILGADGAAVLDDFRRLEVHGRGSSSTKGKRDKGHAEQLRSFVAAARGLADPPVPFEEQLTVAAAALAVVESARIGRPVDVRPPV
jgi:predicted dehydrogenase/threonine dehydrogenase-like Zn-dependent dehydrogenase